MPRMRALLSLRAVNSLKKVFGANHPAWLTLRRSSAVNVSPGTAVTLTGRFWGSSGAFCAVTVIGGSVRVAAGCGAVASDGAMRRAAHAPATSVERRHVVLDINGFSHNLGPELF